MTGLLILICCVMRSAQLAHQSALRVSRWFWVAAVLVFLTVIRRELNFLPELIIPKGLIWHGHSYDWWEDGALLLIYIIALGLLAYAWRYVVAVLKRVPISLYLLVGLLAILQYMGENHILIPEAIGVVVEELSEDTIYAIALIYLMRFDLTALRQQFITMASAPSDTPAMHEPTNS